MAEVQKQRLKGSKWGEDDGSSWRETTNHDGLPDGQRTSSEQLKMAAHATGKPPGRDGRPGKERLNNGGRYEILEKFTEESQSPLGSGGAWEQWWI